MQKTLLDLKEKVIVGITSPPFEDMMDTTKHGIDISKINDDYKSRGKIGHQGDQLGTPLKYGVSNGQIGKLKSKETIEDFNITKYHSCLEDLYWYGCYDSDALYKQFITSESYSHPAKASFLLIERIFRHLEKLELLTKDMTVCDFMAGSGRIPLLASLKDYKTISVELEPHFIKMIKDNKNYAENKTGKKLNMEIIQGDSRQLSKLLSEVDIGVVSPPFQDMNHPTNYLGKLKKESCSEYSDNKNNIGNLPYKEMVGVVSPPYADKQVTSERSFGHTDKATGKVVGKLASKAVKKENIGYSKNMVGIVSPPFSDGYSIREGGQVNKEYVEKRKEALIKKGKKEIADNLKVFEYNTQNPQNIGNLKDNPIVGITSPPYSHDSIMSPSNKSDLVKEKFHNVPYSKETIDFESRRDEKTGRFLPHQFKNIGRLKDNIKDSSIVGITSPPYVAQSGGHNVKGGHIDEGLLKRSSAGRIGDDRYTPNKQNISQLKDNQIIGITSPPYTDIGHTAGNNADPNLNPKRLEMQKRYTETMRGEGNIQKLPDNQIIGITSPPYEKHEDRLKYKFQKGRVSAMMPYAYDKSHHSKSNENLGNQQGESYLQAMLQVYKEAYKVMPVIVTITKNPTRAGKLRRLDLDTARLLEMAGYKIVDYHRAILYKTFAQKTLKGETKQEYKGRLSFFKRLSLQKGNIASQWEDILIAKRI